MGIRRPFRHAVRRPGGPGGAPPLLTPRRKKRDLEKNVPRSYRGLNPPGGRGPGPIGHGFVRVSVFREFLKFSGFFGFGLFLVFRIPVFLPPGRGIFEKRPGFKIFLKFFLYRGLKNWMFFCIFRFMTFSVDSVIDYIRYILGIVLPGCTPAGSVYRDYRRICISHDDPVGFLNESILFKVVSSRHRVIMVGRIWIDDPGLVLEDSINGGTIYMGDVKKAMDYRKYRESTRVPSGIISLPDNMELCND